MTETEARSQSRPRVALGMMRYAAVVLLGLCAQPLVFADASYQETTEITGGSLVQMMKVASVFSSRARQAQAPTTSSVMIHQNRMVRTGPFSTEIIDLDQQTITHIDLQKRQYYTTTFAQMREAMQRAAEQMKQKEQEQQRQPKEDNGNPSANVSFSAKVHETGTTKQVDGQNAKEAILTLSMDATSTTDANQKGSLAITSDMWLIADAPGYEEVKSFNVRMAKELAMDTEMNSMAALLNAQPGAGQAMADMKKEMSKMAGIPVLQVMRMGMTANGAPLPAPSQDPAQAPSANNDRAAENAKSSMEDGVANSLGNVLGGGRFGGLMRHKSKKKAEDSETANNGNVQKVSTQNANGQNGSAPQSAVLLEMSTHRSNFSAGPVDTSNFEVPAGFKQMESPMNRNR